MSREAIRLTVPGHPRPEAAGNIPVSAALLTGLAPRGTAPVRSDLGVGAAR